MALPLIFPFRVRAEITDDMSLPGLAVIYGDGYKQRRRNGLVVPKTVWNIECILNDKTDEITLENFIRLVGNYTYFLWQSPRDVAPRLYYLTGRVSGSYRLGGGSKKDFFVRTMQFEDANIVIVPPTPTHTPNPTPTPTPTPTPNPTPIPTPTPILPIATITGTTETTGFTISISTVQPIDTIVNLRRVYFGNNTTIFNDDLNVTIPASSLSVNLPFGDRRTTDNAGSIQIFIIAGSGYSFNGSSSTNIVRIFYP